MKQVVLSRGRPLVKDIPPPVVQPGMILVEMRATCISTGTERTAMQTSGEGLLQKALKQPDKAFKALESMRRQGIGSVLKRAREKLDADRLVGYSGAGTVIALGEEVQGFSPGDRVAVAGAGYASHAERVVVPVNLAVPLPKSVDWGAGATVALGSIALQGVRRAQPQLGEFVAVIGCGALGLLTIELLKANGCRVIALEPDASRRQRAAACGAELTLDPASDDVVNRAIHHCNGQGTDAVLITAATSSNTPLSQAFQISRRKGRVVLVGVVGNEFKRSDMYEKELDFLISTSYGPGRYDELYERFGLDYPYGYVRWTERRNMEQYLQLVAEGRVRPNALIGKRFPVEAAADAYAYLEHPEKPLLAVLEYEPSTPEVAETAPVSISPSPRPEWRPISDRPLGVAIIGAGAFVSGVLAPCLTELKDRYTVRVVANQTGPKAKTLSERFVGSRATTDIEEAITDDRVDVVLIGTYHDTHASFIEMAMRAGKAVFVEKPMCLNPVEFESLDHCRQQTSAPFMVGYNRRFSPLARIARTAISNRSNPVMIQYTMNAGYRPLSHRSHSVLGGGRILGEACHIFDLFRFLINAPVTRVSVESIRPRTDSLTDADNRVITVRYEDGSVASLLYTATGHPSYAKESMHIFVDGNTMVLNDYREWLCYGGDQAGKKLHSPDKGHRDEWVAFSDAIRAGHRFPIPWEELAETWWLSFQASQPVDLPPSAV